MKKLKGAVIGIGNIALGSHIPAYIKENKRVEIVAGLDQSAHNLEAFKKFLPQATAYLDEKELFANHELDFIDICTPPGSHNSFIEQASSRRINILCEKPLVTSIEEMHSVVRMVKEAEIVFLPCHQYHYSHPWLKALKLVKDGCIGDPHLIQFEVLRKEPNPGNVNWQPNWRVDKAHSGGGIVMDHGIHLFYLAMELLGRPKGVEAKLMCLHHKDSGLEDTAWVLIEHEQGMTRLDLTWASFQRGVRYRILGRKGEIVISESEISVHNQNDSCKESINDGISKDSKHSGWFEGLINDFLTRVENKRIDWDPLHEAAMSLQCALLAYQAADEAKQMLIQPL